MAGMSTGGGGIPSPEDQMFEGFKQWADDRLGHIPKPQIPPELLMNDPRYSQMLGNPRVSRFFMETLGGQQQAQTPTVPPEQLQQMMQMAQQAQQNTPQAVLGGGF